MSCRFQSSGSSGVSPKIPLTSYVLEISTSPYRFGSSALRPQRVRALASLVVEVRVRWATQDQQDRWGMNVIHMKTAGEDRHVEMEAGCKPAADISTS
jgi:hypothetical protein